MCGSASLTMTMTVCVSASLDGFLFGFAHHDGNASRLRSTFISFDFAHYDLDGFFVRLRLIACYFFGMRVFSILLQLIINEYVGKDRAYNQNIRYSKGFG